VTPRPTPDTTARPAEATTREVGRELDALIAEKIFGAAWAWEQHEWADRQVERLRMPSCLHVASRWDGRIHATNELLRYSTNVGDSWWVVEKMEVRGFHWRLTTPFVAGDLYYAGLTPMGVTGWNGRPDNLASANLMPLAICRAALAAIESLAAPSSGYAGSTGETAHG